jgi:hypothetical protein
MGSFPNDTPVRPVNAFNFGLIPNDPNAATANAQAFQRAIAASPYVRCPDGLTFYTETILIPPALRAFFGYCTLVGGGNLNIAQGVLVLSNNAGLRLRGLSVRGGIAPGIQLGGGTDINLDDVTATGRYGVVGSNVTGLSLKNIKVPSCQLRGVYLGSCADVTIDKPIVDGIYGSDHAISLAGGQGIKVLAPSVRNSPAFGISLAEDGHGNPIRDFVVADGIFRGGMVESINVTNGQQGTISANDIMASPNAIDFGLSLWGNPANSGLVLDVTVTGNTIRNAHKAAIGIADRVQRCHITGSTIISPNQGNGSTDDFTSGIVLYGANCAYNHVAGNYFDDPTGNMKWKVSETSAIDGSLPAMNTFAGNISSARTASGSRIVGTGSRSYEAQV